MNARFLSTPRRRDAEVSLCGRAALGPNVRGGGAAPTVWVSSAPRRLGASIRLSFRALLLVTAASLALGACKTDQKSIAPVEVAADTSCSLDGMLLADFPGPKAQIHYEQGKPDFFCDTVEMFSLYLRPEQQKRVKAVFVQNMGATDWTSPQGHWIDAKAAFYVQGSKLKGSMGPTLASFATEAGAKAFAAKNGGTVLPFAAIKPEMVVLDGGSVKDQRM